MIKIRHATELFQLILMTEIIYFSPSKLNQTQIDLHKSVQQLVMKILQWVTHEKMRLLKLISEFLDQQNSRY